MAANKKPEPTKPINPSAPENAFVELMLVAADFVKCCGGIEQAKKSLDDAGRFIVHAGGVANATRALEVLANLKEKITD